MANNYTPRRAAPSGDPAPRRSTSRDTGYPSSSRSYAPRETHYDPDNRPSAPRDSRYSSQNRPVRTTRPAPRQEEEEKTEICRTFHIHSLLSEPEIDKGVEGGTHQLHH